MRRLGDLRTTKRSTRFDDESVRETQVKQGIGSYTIEIVHVI